jgi:hypothetical protein
VRCAGEFFFFLRGTEANRIGFLFSVRGELPQIGLLWRAKALSGSGMFFALFSLIPFSFFLRCTDKAVSLLYPKYWTFLYSLPLYERSIQ